MKVIVSGGAGFIGSHLCDKLIERGDQVWAIDNLLTGNIDNITHLQNNDNFQFVEVDASQPLPEDLPFDQIYHLASPASPNRNNPKSYQALPFDTMQVNSFGTWNLCEEAIKRGSKFLFASTSEVYGDPLEHPQKETYHGNVSTTGPRSVYDEAKRFGETIVAAYVRYNQLQGKIVRIFNTYGPRMPRDGRVVIEFVLAALEGQPFPVFGDGTQTRSFCYVSDLVDGLIATMNQDTPKDEVEIYNLGNPGEFTILELAAKIKQLTNSQSVVEIVESLPQDDPTKRRPDISKAQQYLGWEPKIGLDEGLKNLIDWIKSHSE